MAVRGAHNSAITWTPHVRLAWGGKIGAGKEVWTNSVRYLYANRAYEPTLADLDAIMGLALPKLTVWMNSPSAPGSGITTQASLEWIKANYVLSTGLQRDSNTHILDVAPVLGIVGAAVPFYQTVAVTLRTNAKRGRAHSGRVFPPCVSADVDGPSGLISASAADSYAKAFAQVLNGLNAAISANGTQIGAFAICSPGNTVTGIAPTSQIITGTVCDRVPDVQHRRTNRIPRSEGPATVIV